MISTSGNISWSFMEKSPLFTVVINSCDQYSDCWPAFFKLFHKYWPDLEAPILLNADTMLPPVNAINVTSTEFAKGSATRVPWCIAVRTAIERAQTPLVLYLQEDYFLDAPVPTLEIARIAEAMLARPNVGCVQLTEYGSYGPFAPDDDPRFMRIRPGARYRISHQAALWRKDCLKRYTPIGENGWMCEVYGSWRSRSDDTEFLAVNRQRYGVTEAKLLSYICTGIVKGRWHKEIPALFEREGIELDFSTRGFYTQPSLLLRKWETGRKLLSDPGKFAREFAKSLAPVRDQRRS